MLLPWVFLDILPLDTVQVPWIQRLFLLDYLLHIRRSVYAVTGSLFIILYVFSPFGTVNNLLDVIIGINHKD